MPERRLPSLVRDLAVRIARPAAAAALILAGGSATALAGPTPPPDPVVTTQAVALTSMTASALNPVSGDLYVASAAQDTVVQLDPQGAPLGSVSVPDPQALAISPDGQTLWVASQTQSQVSSFDALTLAAGPSYQLSPAAGCPASLVALADAVWVAYRCGGTYLQASGLARIDPQAQTVTELPLVLNPAGGFPDLVQVSPSGLVAVDSWRAWRVDITDPDNPTVAAMFSISPVTCQGVASAAYSAASDEVLIPCLGGGSGLFGLNASDLSPATAYTSPNGIPYLVAADGAGHVYAEDITSSAGFTSFVYRAGAGDPVERYAPDPSYRSVAPGGLLASADGSELYTFTYPNVGSGLLLTRVQLPATPRGIVSAGPSSATVIKGAGVTLTGSLLLSDGASADGVTLSVSRHDPDGSDTALSDALTQPDGSFQLADVPAQAGAATYTIAYPGDATHAAGAATVDVAVQLPTPSLTLTASARTITYGQTETLTAHLSGHGSNSTVSLYAGSAHVASASVSGVGVATFRVKPQVTTAYHVAYAGDETMNPRSSAPVSVAVRWRVVETTPGSYGQRGAYHLFHYHTACGRRHAGCPAFAVAVAPNAGRLPVTVQIQEHVHGGWYPLMDRGLRLSPTGTYKVLIVYTSSGIKGVPFRGRLAPFPTTRTHATTTPPWTYFEVTS